MASLKGIGREHVLSAVAEYDQLGQDEFLSKYGFKQARDYVLVHDGKGHKTRGRTRESLRHVLLNVARDRHEAMLRL